MKKVVKKSAEELKKEDFKELITAIDMIEKERDISKEVLLKAVEDSLLQACKEQFDKLLAKLFESRLGLDPAETKYIDRNIGIKLAEVFACGHSECGVDARAAVAVLLVYHVEDTWEACLVAVSQGRGAVGAAVVHHDDLQHLE